MSERDAVITALALSLPFAALGLASAVVSVRRLRRVSDQPLAPAGEGVTTVPVRRLARSGFMSRSSNGLNPKLQIEPEGLRFRVFRSDFWRFGDIVRVDVSPLPWTTSLTLRAREGDLLVALADRRRGREFLRALPRNLPLTPRAAALRDGAD